MNDKIKGYMGNPNLISRFDKVPFSEDDIVEFYKCSKDPIYFIKKYVKIVSLDKGLVPFKLWGFQKRLIRAIHGNRFVISKFQRQSGKCHSKDTKYTIRNKKTGEIFQVTAEEFHNMCSKK